MIRPTSLPCSWCVAQELPYSSLFGHFLTIVLDTTNKLYWTLLIIQCLDNNDNHWHWHNLNTLSGSFLTFQWSQLSSLTVWWFGAWETMWGNNNVSSNLSPEHDRASFYKELWRLLAVSPPRAHARRITNMKKDQLQHIQFCIYWWRHGQAAAKQHSSTGAPQGCILSLLLLTLLTNDCTAIHKQTTSSSLQTTRLTHQPQQQVSHII